MIKAGIFDVGGVLIVNNILPVDENAFNIWAQSTPDFQEKYVHHDVATLIKQLKKQKIKLAVLSNTIAIHKSFLAQEGIYTAFDETIFSYEVNLDKPNPQIYYVALEMLSVKPEEAFYVDDLKENVLVANELGMHGFLFTSAKKLIKDLAKIGVSV